MKKFGKFLVAMAAIGAAVGGIFYFMKKKGSDDDFDDLDDFEDDFDDDFDDEDLDDNDTEEGREYTTLKDEDETDEVDLDEGADKDK